jgi:hypothetical protein
MNNLVRLREARSQVVKVQRRIWILQAVFWPVVVLGGIVIAAAVARLAWRRYSSSAEAHDATVTSQNRTGSAEPALSNGDSPGESGRF